MINEILKKYIEKQGAQLPKLAEEPVKYHVEKKLDE